MIASDDLASVEKVLAGDVDAFEVIVRRWHRPLINLAYRFCRDTGRAEELAQEALLRSYRALHQWRKNAAFSTWLFALATNFYRSELRRLPVKAVSIEEAVELADSRPVDGGLEDRDRDRAVRELVLTLPAKYRDVILLYYFNEIDVAAAAKSLDLAEGHGQGQAIPCQGHTAPQATSYPNGKKLQGALDGRRFRLYSRATRTLLRHLNSSAMLWSPFTGKRPFRHPSHFLGATPCPDWRSVWLLWHP